MPLSDDIRALRDRTLADLDAAHDYFFHTEAAWNVVRQAVTALPPFSVQNLLTGTALSGAELAVRGSGYVSGSLTEATFQQFLATFEAFVGDLLRLWLTAYPRGIGGKTVKLEDALDAGDLPTLVARLVDHEIAEVTYKSTRTVFLYLERRVGLPLPAAADIDRLAEAKATRDVLVHNRGVADAEYRVKAGALARHPAGERVEIPKPYHRETWELVKQLITQVADAAAGKAA
jgi:hypothetical protein